MGTVTPDNEPKENEMFAYGLDSLIPSKPLFINEQCLRNGWDLSEEFSEAMVWSTPDVPDHDEVRMFEGR
jgi:hypothetical protein